jgi:hypothetical protein
METTALKLAEDLPSLPIDAVTQKFAWLGTSGSGKTYGSTKLAELMLNIGAQIVVLDPVGVWYGLRLGGPGYKIAVFGGLHGDLPIDDSYGTRLADLIVDKNISAILDVSQFESDEERDRFATDFMTRFFFRKKELRSAVHIFVEECQEFVPQEMVNKRMVAAFNRLIKIGRNFGIGVSLVSQRPQEVNKKVLNLCETLFAFRTVGRLDRAQIEGWVSSKGYAENLDEMLPTLQTGSPHVWSPSWLGVSKVVRILPKVTRDVSETPKVGVAPTGHESLPPINLEDLRASLKELEPEAPEDVDEDLSPATYRARIRKLLAQAHSQQTQIARLQEELGQQKGPVLDPKPLLAALDGLRMDMDVMNASYKDATATIGTLIDGLLGPKEVEEEELEVVEPEVDEVEELEEPEEDKTPTVVDGVQLSRCARVFLAIIARRKGKVTGRLWLAIRSKYSIRSSGFANNISVLRTNGFIVDEAGGYKPTRTGIAHAKKLNEYKEAWLDTAAKAQLYWQKKLPRAQGKVLGVLLHLYPKVSTKAVILNGTGISSTSSGLANAVSALRKSGFVSGRKLELKASEAFFEE